MADGSAIKFIYADKTGTSNAGRQSWKKAKERRQGMRGTQRIKLKTRQAV